MTIGNRLNKYLWGTSCYEEKKFPNWPCPTCGKGSLNFNHTKFDEYQPQFSKNKESREDFDQFDHINSFDCQLECSICFEKVKMVGIAYNEPIGGTDYKWSYEPNYFFPPLHLVDVITEYPYAIKKLLVDSFRLFWLDYESCSNKLRNLVEAYLKLKIPDFYEGNKNKFVFLYHALNEYKNINPNQYKTLNAIRFIGNAGSHNEKIQRSDLLDAYVLIDSVLKDEYDPDFFPLDEIIKAIEEAKGPRSKKK